MSYRAAHLEIHARAKPAAAACVRQIRSSRAGTQTSASEEGGAATAAEQRAAAGAGGTRCGERPEQGAHDAESRGARRRGPSGALRPEQGARDAESRDAAAGAGGPDAEGRGAAAGAGGPDAEGRDAAAGAGGPDEEGRDAAAAEQGGRMRSAGTPRRRSSAMLPEQGARRRSTSTGAESRDAAARCVARLPDRDETAVHSGRSRGAAATPQRRSRGGAREGSANRRKAMEVGDGVQDLPLKEINTTTSSALHRWRPLKWMRSPLFLLSPAAGFFFLASHGGGS
ncbi:hypothetical protein BRADI_1g28484v3 [Brachypodium distachyon]|uniref:Uncharacterized protein n=1 Tax=Brachypodium distachyon TaxID=15368 RepID=A0A2K2DLM9_BRADI|nr:hypothetical protein BRADI_1g28484v3 [Brachypodium distachyon]